MKQKPEIQHTQNAFKIILPNRNQNLERKEEYEVLSKTEQQIIELMKQNGKLSRKEIETKLELSTSTVLRLLKKLTEKNLVVQNTTRTSTCLPFSAASTSASTTLLWLARR